MKSALILGVSGQDGAYLSRLLLAKGYAVHGTSRDAERQPFARLQALGIRQRVQTHTVSTCDRQAMRALLQATRPDEIYNFSGLSSVGLSFEEPAAAMRSIAGAQQLLLDAVLEVIPTTRLYHAASTECFGELPHGQAFDETTPFAPRSPYAEAKAAAHEATLRARAAHALFAVSGIACNHESPLRGEQFVTRKIVAAAAEIASGRSPRTLVLGDTSVERDWGFAGDYVEAMWLMLQQEEPRDFVIATGETHTVGELVEAVFAGFGLDHREHATSDPALFRPSDVRYSRGNPARAGRALGWSARTRFHELVNLLVDAERERQAFGREAREQAL